MFAPVMLESPDRAAEGELARIEDASLNASQPFEQLLVDGWLLRFSPGRARRARSVNAISAGRLDLAAKLALCRAYYERAAVPLLFRITPFSQPATLDAFLQERGFESLNVTCVMSRPLAAGDPADAGMPTFECRAVEANEFAAAVGALRGSPPLQISAHAARLCASPLRHSSVRRVFYVDGEAVAAGQIVAEAEMAGLYDIVTAPRWRRQGLARVLVQRLLSDARDAGARTAYLQVDEDNVAARHLYFAFGFQDRYAYWYRQPAGSAAEPTH